MIPRANPKFLEGLIKILGKPSRVEFSIYRSKEVEEGIKKALAELEITPSKPIYILNNTFSTQIPVKELLRIYERTWEFDPAKLTPEKFEKLEAPEIEIKEMEWYKEGAYDLSFNCYSIKGRINPSKISPKSLKTLFDLISKYQVGSQLEIMVKKPF